MNFRRNIVLLALAFCQTACEKATVRGAPSENTKILLESPELKNLISACELSRKAILQEYTSAPLATPEDFVRHNNMARSNPDHDTLMAEINAQPGFEVAGGTPVEDILWSECGCHSTVLSTVFYLKIRILDGPRKGKEGWTCILALNDPRTGMP